MLDERTSSSAACRCVRGRLGSTEAEKRICRPSGARPCVSHVAAQIVTPADPLHLVGLKDLERKELQRRALVKLGQALGDEILEASGRLGNPNRFE